MSAPRRRTLRHTLATAWLAGTPLLVLSWRYGLSCAEVERLIRGVVRVKAQ